MKYLFVVSFLIFLTSNIKCQTTEVRELLSTIEGNWNIDDNGNVTYQRIIEAPELSKDEIYNRATNYFIYNYGSGKSVIQTQDKDNGQIIGKGLFENVHKFSGFGWTIISTWHILRIDVKDGRARVMITLTEYFEDFKGGSMPPSTITHSLNDDYPVNQNGDRKNNMGKAFYGSHLKAIECLDAVERALKEGNTSKKLENEDW